MKLLNKIHTGETYIIAEMSGNHGGNLNRALEIVKAAADAGADCLKTQTYTADSITLNCDKPHFQIGKGLWSGRSLYDLYSEAHTPFEWQPFIKEECDRLGIDFLSSVFDFSSVDYLENMGVGSYKIASPELVDIPLIEYAASKQKTMIMSCGMASLDEIQDAVDACYSAGNRDLILLKCTSEYPAIYEDMNIMTMVDMAQRFECPVGLSDHSMGYAVDIAAVTLGASVIEKHFCITRDDVTVDSSFSMNVKEFAEMVEQIKLVEKAIGKVSYSLTEQEKESLICRRSLYAATNISEGDVFTSENIRSIRPAYGLAPKYYNLLLGTKATRNIAFGEPLLSRDLELTESPVVFLRPISTLEVERTYEWVKNSWYVDDFCGHAVDDINRHKEYFDKVISRTKNWQESGEIFLAAFVENEHIGNAGLKNITNDAGELWYYIGSSTMRGKGTGYQLVKSLLEFGINECNLKSLYARVKKNNHASSCILEKLGFTKTDESFDQEFKCCMCKYELSCD